jgi:tetratricopeptide (TPR) repeat protein
MGIGKSIHPMSVGRNDPCPCGSGKKYKKCCLTKDEAARRTASASVSEEISASKGHAPPPPPGMYEAPIDQLSNAAVDAIESGRFEQAEKLCERLLREYPQKVDGHDRFGMLREAQGRFQEAADHYTQALAMIEEQREAFDDEAIAYFRESLNRARSNIKP